MKNHDSDTIWAAIGLGLGVPLLIGQCMMGSGHKPKWDSDRTVERSTPEPPTPRPEFEKILCTWQDNKDFRECFKQALNCEDPAFVLTSGDAHGFGGGSKVKDVDVFHIWADGNWGANDISYKVYTNFFKTKYQWEPATVFAACNVGDSPLDTAVMRKWGSGHHFMETDINLYTSCIVGGPSNLKSFRTSFEANPKSVKLKIGPDPECP